MKIKIQRKDWSGLALTAAFCCTILPINREIAMSLLRGFIFLSMILRGFNFERKSEATSELSKTEVAGLLFTTLYIFVVLAWMGLDIAIGNLAHPANN